MKINIVTSWANAQMTPISHKMLKLVIFSENSCHFVSCSVCNNSYVFSAGDKSRGKWDNSRNSTQKMRKYSHDDVMREIHCHVVPLSLLFFVTFYQRIRPIHLYLIFEKPSWKNPVRRTGFLVYFELDFYCLCSLQKSILKSIFAG